MADKRDRFYKGDPAYPLATGRVNPMNLPQPGLRTRVNNALLRLQGGNTQLPRTGANDPGMQSSHADTPGYFGAPISTIGGSDIPVPQSAIQQDARFTTVPSTAAHAPGGPQLEARAFTPGVTEVVDTSGSGALRNRFFTNLAQPGASQADLTNVVTDAFNSDPTAKGPASEIFLGDLPSYRSLPEPAPTQAAPVDRIPSIPEAMNRARSRYTTPLEMTRRLFGAEGLKSGLARRIGAAESNARNQNIIRRQDETTRDTRLGLAGRRVAATEKTANASLINANAAKTNATGKESTFKIKPPTSTTDALGNVIETPGSFTHGKTELPVTRAEYDAIHGRALADMREAVRLGVLPKGTRYDDVIEHFMRSAATAYYFQPGAAVTAQQ